MQWKREDSIWFQYSFGLKLEESIFCLPAACHTVIHFLFCPTFCELLPYVQLHDIQLFAHLTLCYWIWNFCLESRKSGLSCYTNATFQCIGTFPWTIQAFFHHDFFSRLAQHSRWKETAASICSGQIIKVFAMYHFSLFFFLIWNWIMKLSFF